MFVRFNDNSLNEPELFRRVVRDFLAQVAPEALADGRPQVP